MKKITKGKLLIEQSDFRLNNECCYSIEFLL